MADSIKTGVCYWLTGLPGAGKTTLAGAFRQRLGSAGHPVCVLDADVLRDGINRDLGFSPNDRSENVRRIAEIARLFVMEGFVVIVACIAPYRVDRDRARRLFPEAGFFEVFVDAPVEVCIARDPKGLYLRARQGAVVQFTGVSAPYERPLHPDIVLTTAALPLDSCVDALLGHFGHLMEMAAPHHARPAPLPALSDFTSRLPAVPCNPSGGDR